MVKKGAPLIVEIGPLDMPADAVSVLRRDRLYGDNGKLASAITPRQDFVANAAGLLEEIQAGLLAEATARRDANIRDDVTSVAGLADHFEKGGKFPGWVSVGWSKPTGPALDKVVETLKGLKLTIRNTPLDAAPVGGACPFTGEPAVERILIARAY